MSAADITPVLLTRDEEPNIGRTLESLRWAERVVICDSESRDRTESIARSFPNVAFVSHPWTTHAEQWRYALFEAGASSPWLLALDADMSVPAGLRDELAVLSERADVDGVVIGFRYLVGGEALRGSFYPAQLRMLRREKASVVQRGHTHEFRVDGAIVRSRTTLDHDDRKPFDRFVAGQLLYSERECEMLLGPDRPRTLREALRLHMPLLPELVSVAAYLRAGGPFRGAAARRYGLERLLFEAMLRYRLLESRERARRPENEA